MRLLAPLALAILLTAAAAAQPALSFETLRHDFGTLAEGETVTHVFTFSNAGEAALTIADVFASCGCTVPDWSRQPVAPGEAGQVTVAYESEGRPGPFEKTVRVDAGESGVVTLRVAGTVTAAFVPQGVAMGSLTFDATHRVATGAADRAVQEVFRYQNTGDHPVRILSTEAEGAETVFPSRPIHPGDMAAVLVMLEPGVLGPDGLAVAVETDDPAMPTKRLRITPEPER